MALRLRHLAFKILVVLAWSLELRRTQLGHRGKHLRQQDPSCLESQLPFVGGLEAGCDGFCDVLFLGEVILLNSAYLGFDADLQAFSLHELAKTEKTWKKQHRERLQRIRSGNELQEAGQGRHVFRTKCLKTGETLFYTCMTSITITFIKLFEALTIVKPLDCSSCSQSHVT